MSNARTDAQNARTVAKDTSGRFLKNRCECCKKPAPMDYFSAGPYVVLCEKCCEKVEAAP
jgi:hypothetical protein